MLASSSPRPIAIDRKNRKGTKGTKGTDSIRYSEACARAPPRLYAYPYVCFPVFLQWTCHGRIQPSVCMHIRAREGERERETDQLLRWMNPKVIHIWAIKKMLPAKEQWKCNVQLHNNYFMNTFLSVTLLSNKFRWWYCFVSIIGKEKNQKFTAHNQLMNLVNQISTNKSQIKRKK